MDIEQIAARAATASAPFAATTPRRRAAALVAVADALDAHAVELIVVAMKETGLTEAPRGVPVLAAPAHHDRAAVDAIAA